MTTQEYVELRPRSIGELLDQAIRLFRNNFVTYVGIIAVMQVPLTLLQLAISYFTFGSAYGELFSPSTTAPSTETLESMVSGMVVSVIAALASFILIQGIASAALTRTIADNYLGRKTGILEAYKRIGASWISVIGALIISLLIVLVVFIWMIIPIVGWLTGPGIMFFIFAAVVPMIAPSVVLEQKKAGEGWSRAWNLGLKRFWWLIGYMLILGVLSYLIISAPAYLVSAFFQSRMAGAITAGTAGNLFSTQMIVQTLVSLILSLLYYPLRLTGVVLAYFDLRVRYEGFDLFVASQQSQPSDLEVAESISFAPTAEVREKLSFLHVGYFIGLTLIFIFLYVILMAFVFLMAVLFNPAF